MQGVSIAWNAAVDQHRHSCCAPDEEGPHTSAPRPSRRAMRRAVTSRAAVIASMSLRAFAKIAGEAVSGVPLLKGGSGA